LNRFDFRSDEQHPPRIARWLGSLLRFTETNSNQAADAPTYSDQQRNIAAVMWPRFTCCNWCAGSIEAPERHFEVGKGF
jgi:hypothetical protein